MSLCRHVPKGKKTEQNWSPTSELRHFPSLFLQFRWLEVKGNIIVPPKSRTLKIIKFVVDILLLTNQSSKKLSY